MSIQSENPKKRLFVYVAENAFEGNKYKEQFYYRIETISYDSRQAITKVNVLIIFNVIGYLQGDAYSQVPVTFEHPIPEDVQKAVAEYETLKKLNKG